MISPGVVLWIYSYQFFLEVCRSFFQGLSRGLSQDSIWGVSHISERCSWRIYTKFPPRISVGEPAGISSKELPSIAPRVSHGMPSRVSSKIFPKNSCGFPGQFSNSFCWSFPGGITLKLLLYFLPVIPRAGFPRCHSFSWEFFWSTSWDSYNSSPRSLSQDFTQILSDNYPRSSYNEKSLE